MKYSDIDAVYELELKVFPSPWPKFFFENDLKFPYTVAFVSVIGERIIGYVLGSCINDELHVQNVAVDKAWRGKRLATQMMDRLEREAVNRDCRHFYLEVRTDNKTAIDLYEKRGYTIMYTRYHYYLDGDDAYVMGKELK